MDLNAIATTAVREPGLLVTRCRTVVKVVFGNDHTTWLAAGSSARVMVQKTKRLEGCTPHPSPAGD